MLIDLFERMVYMKVFIVTKKEREGDGPLAGAFGGPDVEIHGVYLSEELADSIADDLDDSAEYAYASVSEHTIS